MAPRRKRKHGAKPGDLIEIFRDGYQHWVVYIGNNEIVHLTRDDPDGGKKARAKSRVDGTGEVKRENIWDVIGDSDFKVNNQLDDKYKRCKSEAIVKEARGMVGEERRYSLIDSNCEHFATELRYGKKESRQVRDRLTAAGVLASVCTCLLIVVTHLCFCCLKKEKEQ
ncbi:Retinoic acid receptor responder protein 3 [Xyrichtys novacula]|uniref:Retinoic acid receptor responder protein 3 n=1 Tax=Xyrichtys novacula TaxID=13765 RepID=A0AAV1GME6_XYRNO|nr:Retinoic acid receptor responder protein 3 [Xyrichtys novacula]